MTPRQGFAFHRFAADKAQKEMLGADMQFVKLRDIHVQYRDEGPRDGPCIVFANSLGTDLRIWDDVVDQLPEGTRVVRYDMRGHGLSDAPSGAYDMGDLVADAAALIDHLDLHEVLFVGLSIGGIIAQGLAAERPEVLRGIVLMDTAAKIGTEAMWEDRIKAVRAGGIEALEVSILERWFSKRYRTEEPVKLAVWRNMLVRTPVDGYAGCSQAIARTDLMESTSRLRLPAIAIGGSEDGSTPPDLVRETAGLIPGCTFHLVRGVGHLPCIEAPDEVAALINGFAKALGS